MTRYEVIAPEISEVHGKVIQTEQTHEFTHWIWWFDNDEEGLTVCPEDVGEAFIVDQTVAFPVRRLP